MRSINDAMPAIPAALAHFDALPDAAHVRLPVVAALKGIGPATVWRWVQIGRLPKPHKLGPNTTAWNVGEIRQMQRDDHPASTPTPTPTPVAPSKSKSAWAKVSTVAARG